MRSLDGLERVALLLVVGGLTVIYAASVLYAPQHVSVAAIDESMVGEVVRVTGNVTVQQESEGTTFLKVSDGSGDLEVVAFEPVDLVSGRQYTVEGRVEVYRGALELILRDVSAPGS